MRPSPVLLPLAMMGALLAAPALAGVASSSDQETASPMVAPGGPTGAAQDKTVELLLQLHDNRSKPAAEAPRRDAPMTGVTPPTIQLPTMGGLGSNDTGTVPSLREGLINEAARFVSDANQEQSPSRARDTDAGGQAALSMPAMAPRPQGTDREPPSILSNPVIRFVRENRALALGAGVAILVGVWLAANVSFRGRRR